MAGKADKALSEHSGVLAAGSKFVDCFKWFFRPQPQPDWGIDAHVEEVEDGAPTGRLFGLQIKSGASYFKPKGDGFVFYGDLKHLDYWLSHSLPVYLILHNPETGLTLWQKIERRLCEYHEKSWSIVVPARNILNERAKVFFSAGLATDDEGLRRLRFLLDRDVMERIGDGSAMFLWEEWLNKGLGLRNLEIYFDSNPHFPHGNADLTYVFNLATHDLGLAMAKVFPWAEYVHGQTIDEDDCEVVQHVLEVELTEAAKGYLAAESFFRDGPSEGPERC